MENVTSAFQVAIAVLVALGGGGVIVAALSGWLGKVWANRLMIEDRARYDKVLEQFKSELDVSRTKLLSAHQDKVALYRHAFDVIAPMIVKLEILKEAQATAPDEVQKHFLAFEHDRLRAYAYVAMFAPQEVMDRFDALVDYLFDVADGEVKYEFKEVRKRGVAFINAIRGDLRIDTTPIEYRGARQ